MQTLTCDMKIVGSTKGVSVGPPQWRVAQSFLVWLELRVRASLRFPKDWGVWLKIKIT